MSTPTRGRVSTHTGITDARGGCLDCNGNTALWMGRNAVGVAARHADAHPDHEVWAEEVISITYNQKASS